MQMWLSVGVVVLVVVALGVLIARGLRDYRRMYEKDPRLLAVTDERANAMRTQALQSSPPDVLLLADAVAIHQSNLRYSMRILGSDHPDTWRARASLARDYRASGYLDLAVEWFEEIVAHAEAAEGADHRLTWSIQAELAETYQAAGRHSEAIALYERTLAETQRSENSAQPHDILAARENLKEAYRIAGRYEHGITLPEGPNDG
jgi:tetratricopeptide (TPR) repeat protein